MPESIAVIREKMRLIKEFQRRVRTEVIVFISVIVACCFRRFHRGANG